MRDRPRVSVLMTVFNAGRFLEPAVKSIMSQTFRDWEMVIVDDGSTDGSADVVARLAGDDSRIRFFPNDANAGQTARLNEGLRRARGEWVARQDADDLSHPLRLSRQFEAVTADPDLLLIGSAGRIIDERDRLVGLLDVPCHPSGVVLASTWMNPILHTSAFFRRSVVCDRCGGYDESFRIAQDYDLWCRVMREGKVANLPGRLVAYRHLESSLSKAGSTRAFDEAARVAAQQREVVKLPDGCDVSGLDSFREGLDPAHAGGFARSVRLAGRELSGAAALDWRRFRCGALIRGAGAIGRNDVIRAAGLFGAAWAASPATALHWLCERIG